jgi:hypothetical protein
MLVYREGGCATVAGCRRDRLAVERGALSRRGHHLTVAGTGAAGVTVVGTKAVARSSQGSIAVAGDECHHTGLCGGRRHRLPPWLPSVIREKGEMREIQHERGRNVG